jgi:hypothetical protein
VTVYEITSKINPCTTLDFKPMSCSSIHCLNLRNNVCVTSRIIFLQVKLVWYYNNALGRPNKKKFIARAKSYVQNSIDGFFLYSLDIVPQIAYTFMHSDRYHGSTLIAASLSG